MESGNYWGAKAKVPLLLGTNTNEGETFIYDGVDFALPGFLIPIAYLGILGFNETAAQLVDKQPRYNSSAYPDGRTPLSQMVRAVCCVCALCVRLFVCVCVRESMHVHECVHLCVRARLNACERLCKCVCIYTYSFAHHPRWYCSPVDFACSILDCINICTREFSPTHASLMQVTDYWFKCGSQVFLKGAYAAGAPVWAYRYVACARLSHSLINGLLKFILFAPW